MSCICIPWGKPPFQMWHHQTQWGGRAPAYPGCCQNAQETPSPEWKKRHIWNKNTSFNQDTLSCLKGVQNSRVCTNHTMVCTKMIFFGGETHLHIPQNAPLWSQGLLVWREAWRGRFAQGSWLACPSGGWRGWTWPPGGQRSSSREENDFEARWHL